MDATLKLAIMTPERKIFEGEVKEITVENEQGRLEILPKHIAMITSLVPTVTIFTTIDGKKLKLFTSTGMLKVEDNVVNMIIDTAEWPEEIDLSRAEDARKKAEQLLKAKREREYYKAELRMKRALARIKAKS